MPKMFISYRRSASSGHAGRLYDRLIENFGAENVFLDVEKIPPGETFSSYLLAKIDECDIFLLMLGEGTLDRTINEEDWVRREIAYALQHENITVIPVLQDGYTMPPPETLPTDIQDITAKNASFLFHQMFDESVTKLIESISSLNADSKSTNEIPIRVIDTLPQPQSVSSNTVSQGIGQVKIHRVGNRVAYRIRPFTIKIDGQEIRQIGNNETVLLDIPVGNHTLSVHVDYHNVEKHVHITQGTLLSFEIHVRNMGLSVVLERI